MLFKLPPPTLGLELRGQSIICSLKTFDPSALLKRAKVVRR